MTTWVVSRHSGAIEWLRRRDVRGDAQVVEHLEPNDIAAGDRVIGTLPVQAIAAVCRRGGVYHHLQIPMTRALRGTELTAADLDALGATLEPYYARRGVGAEIAHTDLPSCLWIQASTLRYLHGCYEPSAGLEYRFRSPKDIGMRATVKKWGNSASVRIPTAIMKSARLRLNDVIDIREQGGRIVIAPVHPRKYDLAELVAGITAENLHPAAEFGVSMGKELR